MTFDLQRCYDNFARRERTRQQQRETCRQQARQVVLAAIRKVGPIYPTAKQIYLFGSITQSGRFRNDSDIDVAVEGTDAASYFALWRDLEQACPRWVIDLRELNTHTPSHFATTVRQLGELVYECSGRLTESKH